MIDWDSLTKAWISVATPSGASFAVLILNLGVGLEAPKAFTASNRTKYNLLGCKKSTSHQVALPGTVITCGPWNPILKKREKIGLWRVWRVMRLKNPPYQHQVCETPSGRPKWGFCHRRVDSMTGWLVVMNGWPLQSCLEFLALPSGQSKKV